MSTSEPGPSHAAADEPAAPDSSPSPEPVPNPDLEAAFQKMLEDLPPGIPILPPEDACNFSKYQHPPRILPEDEAWQKCADAAEKHDSGLCKAYREEIDTLLVFAGLFSAIVTAFTIESYKWLQDDPNDAMITLLSQISLTLTTNGTAPPVGMHDSGLPRSVSTRINVYWFFSLTLSHCATLIATLCKQWIREYDQYAALSPKNFLGMRQMKLEGLEHWGVGDFILALPLLLQLSLGAFLLGMLEFTFQLHTAVASAVIIPAATALIVYWATTVLPVIQHIFTEWPGSIWAQLPPCPYKSPQAFAVVKAHQMLQKWRWEKYIHNAVGLEMQKFFSAAKALVPPIVWVNMESLLPGASMTEPVHAWSALDQRFCARREYALNKLGIGSSPFQGLAWLHQNSAQRGIREGIWSCVWHEAENATSSRRVRTPEPDGSGTDIVSQMAKQNLSLVLNHKPSDAKAWELSTPCSLALLYLSQSELAFEAIAEVFVQNIMQMETIGADAFMENIVRTYCYTRAILDSQTIGSVFRAAASYLHSHATDAIRRLTSVHLILLCSSQSYTVPSVHVWLSKLALHMTSLLSEASDPSISHICSMLVLCAMVPFIRLLLGPEDLSAHPERFHDLPDASEIVLLLRPCFEDMIQKQLDRGIPIADIHWPDDVRAGPLDGLGRVLLPLVLSIISTQQRSTDTGDTSENSVSSTHHEQESWGTDSAVPSGSYTHSEGSPPSMLIPVHSLQLPGPTPRSLRFGAIGLLNVANMHRILHSYSALRHVVVHRPAATNSAHTDPNRRLEGSSAPMDSSNMIEGQSPPVDED